MRLPIHPSTTPIPPHILALADGLMASAQSRFGHGVWSMNAGDSGDGGGDGGTGGDSGGSGDSGTGGSGDGGQGGQGGDLGFPANTAVAEMTDAQQAAYWRNESKKHQGRYNNLTGGRSFDDTKADLDAYAEVKKSEQTPAEQALAERYEQGKKDASTASLTKAATAILTANLRTRFESAGLQGTALDTEVQDTLDVIDVSKFINDDGDIDTDRLIKAASRFGSSDSGRGRGNRDRRDYGAGNRGQGGGDGKTRGQAEADRRFGAVKQEQ